MTWILRFCLFLLLALLAAWLGYTLRRDSGSVYLRFHGWEVETTVVFLALALLLVALLGYGLYALLVRWPRSMGLQRRRRAADRLDRGLALAFEGRLKSAQKALLAASTDAGIRLSALLSAAEIARRRGAKDEWVDILSHAATTDRGRQIAPLLALIWRAEQDDAEAIAELIERPVNAQAPPVLLQRLIPLWLRHGRVDAAAEALQLLQAQRQIGAAELADLQTAVLGQTLAQAKDLEALATHWQALSKVQRRQPGLLQALLQTETRLGGGQIAAEALERELSRQWSEPLAGLYAQAPVPPDTAATRVKRAEALLRKQPQSPGLLLALARWCRADGIYGKASEYLRLALSLDCNSAGLMEAARLAAQREEPDRAALAWRLAAELAEGTAPSADALNKLLR